MFARGSVGIAGLGAALRFVTRERAEGFQYHEAHLTSRHLAGLREIPGVTAYGPEIPGSQVAMVSVTVQGWELVDVGAALDSSFGICIRPGLHCAPHAHRTIGTFAQGTVRLSPGPFTTEAEIDEAIYAIGAIASS